MAAPNETQQTSQGSGHASVVYKNKDGRYLLLTNKPHDRLSYKPEESFMLGVELQYCTHDLDSVEPRQRRNIRKIADALVRTEAMYEEQISIVHSSSEPQKCSKDEIMKLFIQNAAKVNNEGIFVFCFSGPGMEAGGGKWGLATGENNECILAETITSWLRESQCKAKHILLILDCSFAGKIASALQFSAAAHDITVIGSCTANEVSVALSSLGYSVFSYLLHWAIHKVPFAPGVFPLKEIFSLLQPCCSAISSLVVIYDATTKTLSYAPMQPVLKAHRLPHVIQALLSEDATDGVPGSYEFITKHYSRKGRRRVNLHEKCYLWLQNVEDSENGLAQLGAGDNDILNGRILEAVVCALMYSIACFQVALDRSTAAEPNLFIIAFLRVAAAIASHSPDEPVTEYHVKLSGRFYTHVLEQNHVDKTRLEKILKNLEF